MRTRRSRPIDFFPPHARERPEQKAAWNSVTAALAKGELVRQPCRDCGNPEAEAHHPDYSKPLEVIWLCRADHRREHSGSRNKT